MYLLLFSGESCDVTPITSVAPPIPRTPTPGDPPVQTFSVQNGNTDCIVLQAAIEFIIPYTSKGAVSVNVEICFLKKMNYPIIIIYNYLFSFPLFVSIFIQISNFKVANLG